MGADRCFIRPQLRTGYFFGIATGAVVFDGHADAGTVRLATHAHAAARPFAGVVEQVAEQFVHVFAVGDEMQVGGDFDIDA